MLISPYLRKGIVYIPTARKIPNSFYRKTEPVQVASASDIAALTDAFQRAIGIGNPFITEEENAKLSSWMTVARTGVKSWRAFEQGALTWSLTTDPNTGEYHMHPYVPVEGGGWTEGPVPVLTLPADTPIPDVARRTAAVVHDADTLQSQP